MRNGRRLATANWKAWLIILTVTLGEGILLTEATLHELAEARGIERTDLTFGALDRPLAVYRFVHAAGA